MSNATDSRSATDALLALEQRLREAALELKGVAATVAYDATVINAVDVSAIHAIYAERDTLAKGQKE